MNSLESDLRDKLFETLADGLACGLFHKQLGLVASGQVKQGRLSPDDAELLIALKKRMIASMKELQQAPTGEENGH